MDRDPLPLDRDPQTETPWAVTSWTETPLDRDLPWTEPPGQRSPIQRLPWTEEGTWDQGQRPPEGTWDQTARQEVTPYRDPLWTDRHL